MYNFTLHIPTAIHFGKGAISHLDELKNYGNKLLLVYGGGSIKKNGIYDTAM
ncbi:MAG: NADH-dependent alcohol dehydrogenase, partial [Oscillospiraceae bacterium]|nr:NADH-dependent alcohol dehydrogenase [Oscillospiraceae bacterium]